MLRKLEATSWESCLDSLQPIGERFLKNYDRTGTGAIFQRTAVDGGKVFAAGNKLEKFLLWPWWKFEIARFDVSKSAERLILRFTVARYEIVRASVRGWQVLRIAEASFSWSDKGNRIGPMLLDDLRSLDSLQQFFNVPDYTAKW